MRDSRERLRDIQEAIARIERYTIQGRTAFDLDDLIQTWVVHHLQIIGEAANALPQDIRDQAPAIPWRKIIGMRNILVHHYFAVDRVVVWGVVEQDLPELRSAIDAMLAKVDQGIDDASVE
jgi:uncharacterized protein with HEPN domain